MSSPVSEKIVPIGTDFWSIHWALTVALST